MRRFKIDILHAPTKTVDADGIATLVWSTLSTVWADVKDLSGKTFYGAQTITASRAITCSISFREDVTESMRIRFEGDVYRILRVYQGEYRRRETKIDCELIETNTD